MLSNQVPCEYCLNVEDIEGECVGESYEGEEKMCGECGAEYHEEYGGKVWAANPVAHQNHPELEIIYSKKKISHE